MGVFETAIWGTGKGEETKPFKAGDRKPVYAGKGSNGSRIKQGGHWGFLVVLLLWGVGGTI